MDQVRDTLPEIRPVVIRRECGGWLATTPKWAPFKLGVTGYSEPDARQAFDLAAKRWAELLSDANQ